MSKLEDKSINTIRLSHTILKKRNDGLIILELNDNHTFTRDEVIENHDAIKKLSDGKKAFVINIAGKYTSVDPDAKKFTAEGNHESFIGAEAFVIRNLAQRILAQFYFKINKPVVASEYFTDISKAEKWILNQKIKYEKNNK